MWLCITFCYTVYNILTHRCILICYTFTIIVCNILPHLRRLCITFCYTRFWCITICHTLAAFVLIICIFENFENSRVADTSASYLTALNK